MGGNKSRRWYRNGVQDIRVEGGKEWEEIRVEVVQEWDDIRVGGNKKVVRNGRK